MMSENTTAFLFQLLGGPSPARGVDRTVGLCGWWKMIHFLHVYWILVQLSFDGDAADAADQSVMKNDTYFYMYTKFRFNLIKSKDQNFKTYQKCTAHCEVTEVPPLRINTKLDPDLSIPSAVQAAHNCLTFNNQKRVEAVRFLRCGSVPLPRCAPTAAADHTVGRALKAAGLKPCEYSMLFMHGTHVEGQRHKDFEAGEGRRSCFGQQLLAQPASSAKHGSCQ